MATINHLIRDALLRPNGRYAFIAPTYKQAKNIAWDYLKQFSRVIPGIKINESELKIDYPNGSRITLYGSDYPDSLRGIGLDGVVFDEYSQQPSNIFTEIISPALADKKGYAIWIGTPKGHNEFFRLFQYAQTHEQDWMWSLLTVENTDALNEEELKEQKRILSEDEYNQEFMCSFEAAIKGAVYSSEINQARVYGRIKSFDIDRTIPVNTAWDIGVSDYTSIWFYQDVGREIHIIDHYEHWGEGVEFYAMKLAEFARDRGYRYGIHYGPHDLRKTEFGTGKTIYEVSKKNGLTFEVVKNTGIANGIQAVRSVFPRIWIHAENCEKGLDSLTQYQYEWDEAKGCFKPTPLHDWSSHAADALRYLAVAHTDLQPQVARQSYAIAPAKTKQSDLDELFGTPTKLTYV